MKGSDYVLLIIKKHQFYSLALPLQSPFNCLELLNVIQECPIQVTKCLVITFIVRIGNLILVVHIFMARGS